MEISILNPPHYVQGDYYMSVHVIYIVKAHRSCPEKWSDKIIKENGIFSIEKIVGSALEAFLIGRVKKYELKLRFCYST